MTPEKHIKISASILLISICIEATLLSELRAASDLLYTLIHLALVITLTSSQLLLYFSLQDGIAKKMALLFSLGTAITTVGDYINSSISSITPISNKLCFALFLFGAGYTLYNIALWKSTSSLIKNNINFNKMKWLFLIPILAINLFSWFMDVEKNVTASNLLHYGSFVFNATIYVAMPLFALWYFASNNWSLKGLLVFFGALMIPYSDLVLFNSWLHGGVDSDKTTLVFYVSNWIIYFTGQVLISLLPSFVVLEENYNYKT